MQGLQYTFRVLKVFLNGRARATLPSTISHADLHSDRRVNTDTCSSLRSKDSGLPLINFKVMIVVCSTLCSSSLPKDNFANAQI